jgi:two-component system chemotaxis response regulator CheB
MIRVLVVDDSAVVRQLVSRELSKEPDITVVATAPDPYVARDLLVQHRPDVMTLDIEMPRMDGLTFLQKVMKHFPIPTIIVSSLTPQGSQMAFEALEYGAFDVISKPGTAYSMGESIAVLARRIREASTYDCRRAQQLKALSRSQGAPRLSLSNTTNKIIAMGASTGGTVALEQVLTRMPRNAPGIVVVQHMPEFFTTSFAQRLDRLCEVSVSEAKQGDSIVSGRVLIAPGNNHMIVRRSGARYYVEITKGSPVYHQRPSVEVLFQSVAQYIGANAVGILLTGMGSDGARGLLAMREAGAHTIAQDEKSSVVWGMPGEAVKIDAAQEVLPLQSIAERALRMAS